MSETKTDLQSRPELYPAQITPSISVDRALGHTLDNLEIDHDLLAHFYYKLPHEDKPPLSQLSIHFSASSPKKEHTNGSSSTYGSLLWGVHFSASSPKKEHTNGSSSTYGSLLWGGTKSIDDGTTPELPVTSGPTIIVYVGTPLVVGHKFAPDFKEHMADQLSTTLTHELTHYAQGPKGDLAAKKQNSLFNQLSMGAQVTFLHLLLDKHWLKSGAAALLASESLTDNSLPTSAKIAGGVASIVHMARKPTRDYELGRRFESRAFNRYAEDPSELDARHHEIALSGLISATEVEEPDIGSLESYRTVSQKGFKLQNRKATRRHKQAALTPKTK